MTSPEPSPYANVVVDTRPLWRILLERSHRPAILVLGVLLYLAVARAAPVANTCRV